MNIITRLVAASALLAVSGCTVSVPSSGDGGVPTPSPSTTTSPSPTPGGALPAEIVGSWVSTSGVTADNYHFNADGTFREDASTTFDGCNVQMTIDEGTATLEGTTLTLNRSKRTLTSDYCGDVQRSSPDATVEVFQVSTNADGEMVLDSDVREPVSFRRQ